MLTLDSAALSFLYGILGHKLQTCGSSRLSIYKDHAISYAGDLSLVFSHNNEYKYFNLKTGKKFFENSFGEVYHDYSIEYSLHLKTNAEIHLETSVIIEILAYGKLLDIEEFQVYPEIYNAHKEIIKTDEVFLIKCADGECITVAFDKIAPSIEVWFFDNTKHYSTIENNTPYNLNHYIKINA